jgi:ketosteroid isomerase-like protein
MNNLTQPVDQIKGKEKELLNAIIKSDVAALEKLLHEDLLFVIPDGSVITKEMDLASHRAGSMVVERIHTDLEELRIIDDVAIVTLLMDTSGKMLGEDFKGRFRYIRFWKKSGDQWQVIGGSCTALK